MNEDEELIQAFLEESRENLDQMDLDLVALESRPDDPELLARVFRAIHTIKGTSGFLSLERLEALSHAGEDVLGALRAGRLQLDAGITTSLLALVDEVRVVLDRLALDGTEGDAAHGDVIADLGRYLPTPPAQAGGPAAPAPTAAPAPPAPAPAAAAPAVSAPSAPVSAPPAPAPPADTTVRVDVTVLDTLQDLVGELTQANSRLGADLDDDTGAMGRSLQHVRHLTRELQDGVMAARMQPIGTVIGKSRRLARDLATDLGKAVRVEISGEDVGVDRSVVEALRDPITHLIRNAIDHGIEPPDERVRVGKPAEALLSIDASLEAGRVRIDVSDDGRGINLGRLADRAVALGLVTATQAADMDDEQRIELMFRAGLSSRTEATTVSGRGVGMDIVRANLDRIGGSIEVTTTLGLGSRFRIDLPLTLAIIPGVIVGCADGCYVIPQSDVHTILRLTADDAPRIDSVQGARTYRWHGRLLPLVDLTTSLGVETAPSALDTAIVVVVRGHGRLFGLVVDTVADTMDAVVKPLPRALRAVPVYSGVTILPAGRPALILDVAGIGAEAGILAAAIGDLDERPDPGPPATLLLAVDQAGDPVAFPLDAVHRLELVRVDTVQASGGLDVVAYGDAILPLLSVGRALDVGPDRADDTDRGGTLTTVVCATSAGLVGLTVARIEDVAARPEQPAQPGTRRGVGARVVVEDRVTEVLDIEALVADARLEAFR